MRALREHLSAVYSGPSNASGSQHEEEEKQLVHVHFKLHNYMVEYTPLFVLYAVLFLYIYFSVRKCRDLQLYYHSGVFVQF